MEDWVRAPDGSELNGQGHYHEHYEKSGGEWGIKEMRLTRLRMQRGGETTYFT